MVDLLERLDVLLSQEATSYRTVDYLSQIRDKRSTPCQRSSIGLGIEEDEDAFVGSYRSTPNSCTSSSEINELWRERICEWSYELIDHFDFSRETVCISMHYLDRYLACVPTINKKLFQLAAMTTLYLAIKLYERGSLSMTSMIGLSRGCFLVSQMEEMEMDILRYLSWKLHPPTANCFSKHMLFVLAVSTDEQGGILEVAKFLIELSVIDYFFVPHLPSNLALSALLNALEMVPNVPHGARLDFVREVERIPGIDPNSREVKECRERLDLVYAQGGYSSPIEAVTEEDRNESVSPVCVSYGVQHQHHGQQPSAKRSKSPESC